MAKLCFEWMFFLLLSQWVAPSVQLQEFKFSNHGIQVVHEGQHPDMGAAISTFSAKLFAYEYDSLPLIIICFIWTNQKLIFPSQIQSSNTISRREDD